jgi:ABC-type nitrate/sulfonate/bicarbonate transport system permease component
MSSVSAQQVLSAARSALPSVKGFLPLVVFLVGWQLVQSAPSAYFPPPSLWFNAIALMPKAQLGEAITATLLSFCIGVGLATAIGGLLGVWMGYSPLVSRALDPLFEFMRSLPPPTIVPIAVLLIGYDERMKLVVIVLSALWPILLNTAASVQALNPLLLDVGATFRLSHRETIMKIIVPSAVPGLLIGIRVAIPLALVVTLLVEMLTSIPGLGAMIIMAQRNFNAAQVYGLLVLIGVFGFLFNLLFQIFEAIVLLQWPPRAQTEN